MNGRPTGIAAIATGIMGAGLAAFGVVGLVTGPGLVVQGTLIGDSPVVFPSLVPVVAIAAGVVAVVVALLLPATRGRRPEAPLVTQAAANAPLIVARNGDDVTFVWGESRVASRRRGTPRAALTRA